MENEIYTKRRDCRECAQNKLSKKQQCSSKIFSVSVAFEFVAKGILGPISRILSRNKLVLVMMDHYKKFVRAVLASKTTNWHNVSIFLAS